MRIGMAKGLWLFLAFFIFTVIVSAGLTFWSTRILNQQLFEVAEIQLPAVRAISIADMMHDGLRGVAMESLVAAQRSDRTRLGELSKEVVEMSDTFQQQLAELRVLSLSAETKVAIQNAEPEMNSYIAMSKEVVDKAQSQGFAAGIEVLPKLMESFEVLEAKMETLGDLIEAEASKKKDGGEFLTRMTFGFSIAVVVFLAIVGTLAIRWVLRTLTTFVEEISETGGRLRSLSTELTKSANLLSDGSSQSAASIEETVASLDEISAIVSQNSKSAFEAQKVSDENRTNAVAGNEEIASLVNSMNEISASSKKMEEIISVIDDIAFQTNLLALNAAVEAARAGELGRGFAVVADAVRSLAQRSAAAAKDISTMIQENVRKIEQGSKIVERSNLALQSIVNSVEKVSTLSVEIASASKEQAGGIEQLSKAMNLLDSSSQTNAVTAEELSSASTDVEKRAEHLAERVQAIRQFLYQ